MFTVLLVLGIGLVAAFLFLSRHRHGRLTSTDPGGTFPYGGSDAGVGAGDCSSAADAGCSDGGGGDGGGCGGGGD